VTELAWIDSLAAPRSLATRADIAVAVIEDPGVIELHLPVNDLYMLRRCNKVLGLDLPTTPWGAPAKDDLRLVWTGPWRWQILLPRNRVTALLTSFTEAEVLAGLLSDLSGAFTCFRIAGEAADDTLVRVCPLDLRGIEPDHARGTSIADVRVLLVKELGSVKSWMVLASRS